LAIERSISGVTSPAAETPTKTSAPFIASASVRSFVSAAKRALYSFIFSVRPL
jgi:hypothetical protein